MKISSPKNPVCWKAPIQAPFKRITHDDCHSISFLGKDWRVTMNEMVITEYRRQDRVEEGLYTLVATDGEIRRMTSSAYLDLVRENEEDDV